MTKKNFWELVLVILWVAIAVFGLQLMSTSASIALLCILYIVVSVFTLAFCVSSNDANSSIPVMLVFLSIGLALILLGADRFNNLSEQGSRWPFFMPLAHSLILAGYVMNYTRK